MSSNSTASAGYGVIAAKGLIPIESGYVLGNVSGARAFPYAIPNFGSNYIVITDPPYNAVADGSDSGVAIRAAITDGLSTGKPVLIPAGTFDISTYSTSASAIRVTGDGTNSITIEGMGTAVSTLRLVAGGSRNLLQFRQLASITLRNLTLDHQGSLQSAGSGVFFDGSGVLLPHLKITTENVTVKDPFGNGVYHDGDNRDISHTGLSITGVCGFHGVSYSGAVSGATKTISNITQATPGVVTTTTDHGYEDDDWVTLESVVGMTQVNGVEYKIRVLSATTFGLYNDNVPVNTALFSAYVSGGTSAVEINSRGIFMHNTLVEDPEEAGINVSSGRRFLLNNTRVIHSGAGVTHDTGYAGVRVTNNASGGAVNNTYVEGMDRGFFFSGMLDMSATNFNFVNIGTQGVLIQGSPDRTARVKISNGNIYNPGQRLQSGLPAGQGLRLVDAEDVGISNVDIVAENGQMLNGVMESVSVSGVGQRNIKYNNVTQSGATDTPWVLLNGEPGTSVPFTWATKPPAGMAGRQIRITDVGSRDTIWVDTGTRWELLNGSAVLSILTAVSAYISNTLTIVFQVPLLPAGVMQVGDRLRFRNVCAEKDGVTDTGILSIHVGTAGTTADTTVWNGSQYLAAANRTAMTPGIDFRLDSVTSLTQVGNSAAVNNAVGSGTSSSAAAAAVAIPDVSANALYLSIAVASSSTNDDVRLREVQFELMSANS